MAQALVEDHVGAEIPGEGADRYKAATARSHTRQAPGACPSGKQGALRLAEGRPQGRRVAPGEGQAPLRIGERARTARNGLEVISQAAADQARR
eukprot:13402435-Alexandrium_andersonii.AAC.1